MKQVKKLSAADEKRRNRLISVYYKIDPPILTQERFADSIGYGKEYISRMMTGKRRVSDAVIEKISEVYHIRREYLTGEDDFMTEEIYRAQIQYADRFTNLISLSLISSEYHYVGLDADPSILRSRSFSVKYDDLVRAHEAGNRIIFREGTHYDDDYVIIAEDDYRKFCSEISDYIRYKISRLYEQIKYNYPW